MDKSLEQLLLILANRKKKIVTALGKQGRVLISNIESKQSYLHEKHSEKYYLEVIKETDEICQNHSIKI
jgi:hypothetical protein